MFFMYMGPEVINCMRMEIVQSWMKKERKLRTQLVRALDAYDRKASCAGTEAVGCSVPFYRIKIVRRCGEPLKAVEKQANRLHALRIKIDGTKKPPDRASFESDAKFVMGLRKWLLKVPPMELKANLMPC